MTGLRKVGGTGGDASIKKPKKGKARSTAHAPVRVKDPRVHGIATRTTQVSDEPQNKDSNG